MITLPGLPVLGMSVREFFLSLIVQQAGKEEEEGKDTTLKAYFVVHPIIFEQYVQEMSTLEILSCKENPRKSGRIELIGNTVLLAEKAARRPLFVDREGNHEWI